MTGIRYINHQAANPVSGDMRQNTSLGCIEIYNGSSWQTISPGWVETETLSETVEHAVDKIGIYIEEDHADNATIQDAYAEWSAATERFRVVLAMAEK